MAFIRTQPKQYAVGDYVRTTKVHKNFYGEFEVGTLVQVFDISPGGYSIMDDEDNTVSEIGWGI